MTAAVGQPSVAAVAGVGRWLLVTGTLFALSAVAYAWRLRRARTAATTTTSPTP